MKFNIVLHTHVAYETIEYWQSIINVLWCQDPLKNSRDSNEIMEQIYDQAMKLWKWRNVCLTN